MPETFLPPVSGGPRVRLECVRTSLASDVTTAPLVGLHVVDAEVEVRLVILLVDFVSPVKQL